MAGTAADPIDLTADETEERQPAAPPTAAAARERHAVAQPAAEPIVGGAKRQPVQAPTPQQVRPAGWYTAAGCEARCVPYCWQPVEQPLRRPSSQGRERMHAMLRHFHLDPSR